MTGSKKCEDNGWLHTHRVAVGAFIFRDGRVLLLKRKNSPFTFAPPGGRLNVDEDPLAGLRREVREETGLAIHPISIANHWYGSMDGEKPALLCINFLAEWQNGDVHLSEEHSEFVWASCEDIRSGNVKTVDQDGFGYTTDDILDAFARFESFSTQQNGSAS